MSESGMGYEGGDMDGLKQEAKNSLSMWALSESDVTVKDPLRRASADVELTGLSFLIIP